MQSTIPKVIRVGLATCAAGFSLLHAAPDSKPQSGGHVLAAKHIELPKGTVFTTTKTFSCEKMLMEVSRAGETTEGTITRKDVFAESVESLGEGKLRRILGETVTEGKLVMNGQTSDPPREKGHAFGGPRGPFF